MHKISLRNEKLLSTCMHGTVEEVCLRCDQWPTWPHTIYACITFSFTYHAQNHY